MGAHRKLWHKPPPRCTGAPGSPAAPLLHNQVTSPTRISCGDRVTDNPVPKAHVPAGNECSVITVCRTRCHQAHHRLPQAGQQPRGHPSSSPDQNSSHHSEGRT